jgi:hypothetical protein
MNSAEPGGGSIFASLQAEEKKRKDGAQGPNARIKVSTGSAGSHHVPTTKWGPRLWHRGHYLSSSSINNVIKVRYVKNNADAKRHTNDWLRYIQERERAPEEPERKFFDRDRNNIERDEVQQTLLDGRAKDVAFFKVMLSPKQNELDHEAYTREIMQRWEDITGIKTDWHAVKHENTLYHHVHIVMPGKDVEGHSYRLTREHLELMRDIANEHQYELRDLDYQYEKQVEYEFGKSQEDFERLLMYQSGKELERELGLNSPELEQAVRELLPPTNFDDLEFRNELNRTIQERDPDLNKQYEANKAEGEIPNKVDDEAHVQRDAKPQNDELALEAVSPEEIEAELQAMRREENLRAHGMESTERSYESAGGIAEFGEHEVMKHGAQEDEISREAERGDDDEFMI